MPHVPRNIQGGYVAADFWTQWNSITPRMALFIKITPQSFWTSVSPVGLTSNTRDMTLPGHAGVTFKSAPGITPTLVEQVLDEATNLEMTGVYQTGIIEQPDVIKGKWNFATIEVFSASWQNTSLGELVHAKCKTGELKDYQTYFTAEARGYLGLLSNDVNKSTARFCRVKDYGDAECGVDLNGSRTIGATAYKRRQTGIINADEAIDYLSTDGTNWVGTFPAAAELFVNGKITMTSGANTGVSREIAQAEAIFPGMRFFVKRPFPFQTNLSDTYTITAGCPRTLEACMADDNIINRRAEDWIPTLEAANRVPPSN